MTKKYDITFNINPSRDNSSRLLMFNNVTGTNGKFENYFFKSSLRDKRFSKFREDVLSYVEKNSEDFNYRFLSFIGLNIRSFDYGNNGGHLEDFKGSDLEKTSFYLNKLNGLNDELKSLPEKDLNTLLEIFPDIKYFEETIHSFKMELLNEFLRKGDLNDKLMSYEYFKTNQMFSKFYLDKFLLFTFEFFIYKTHSNSTNFFFPEGSGLIYSNRNERFRTLSGSDDELDSYYVNKDLDLFRKFTPTYNVDQINPFESRGKNKYSFIQKWIDDNPNEYYINKINKIPKLQLYGQYWIERFEDIRLITTSDELVSLYKSIYNKFNDTMDCLIIYEIMENIIKRNKLQISEQDLVSMNDFLDDDNCNNNLGESMFKELSNLYVEYKSKQEVNYTGFCTQEKHEERIRKEFYPDNGLKLTRGILKIELKDTGNCKYSWEVYDTTLLGKTRISYFITTSDNPNDSTISLELVGTDKF